MREILFRGKAKDTEKWIYGDLLQYADTAQIWKQTDNGKWNCVVDPETVCQYTGLTDKNGRKIFEGDIVSYIDGYFSESGFVESDCVGKVVWDNDEVCYLVTGRLSVESYEVLTDCYVIGNVFDNPELMD